MRFHYDKEADALYIRFDEGSYAESDELAPGVIFDYDKKRRLIGIEILDASRKLSPESRSSLLKRKVAIRVGVAG